MARVLLGLAAVAIEAAPSPSESRDSRSTDLDVLIELSNVLKELRYLKNSATSDAPDRQGGLRLLSREESADRASVHGASGEGAAAAIADLEREVQRLRSTLTAGTERVLTSLSRGNISPPLAAIADGACSECHLRLPTALASTLGTGAIVARCPHCKRLLMTSGAVPPGRVPSTAPPDLAGPPAKAKRRSAP